MYDVSQILIWYIKIKNFNWHVGIDGVTNMCIVYEL